jgi:hypothetical protein
LHVFACDGAADELSPAMYVRTRKILEPTA